MNKIKKLIVRLLFKKPIRNFVKRNFTDKDEDFYSYFLDLLMADYSRMQGSRQVFSGIYDLDMEINRIIQDEIFKEAKNVRNKKEADKG